ncbi:hypothetical protein GGP84_001587 [Salinibacter ruber]|uniref:hypothetical protein n=1 Tax=Salinibacter ruber TaxID=146919 RepID=UPI00216977C0|nr:hypothetical protein [Salinibacter ruber]MCS3938961.1 hypothetical protein [Salinibacter ruber]
MQRSLFRYTTAFLLPLLAVGLVLTGCDSTGSNGIDNDNGDNEENDTFSFEYPSSTYGTETAVNLLAFDLGVRVGSAAENSESVLLDLYEGNNLDETTLPSALSGSPEQSTYGDVASGVTLSSLVSTEPLIRGNQLGPQDTPNSGAAVNTDELLRFYLQEAGANDSKRTSNGIVLSQFAEKMLLGTPLYGQGAAILSDFADGNLPANQAEQWDAAFGYFGFPRTLEPFLDYSGGTEGLANGNIARDVDSNGSVDLTSEYVHTWASYAIERSAAASSTDGPSPDFARDAFNALVEGRENIENGEDPSSHARTALDAWEKVVAVNVIHYINSMEGNLEDASGTLEGPQGESSGDVGEDAWGEAKAFAWSLQFYSRDALTSQDLNNVLEDIGNDPPYGEMTASEYASDLQDATDILADTYGFSDSNVAAW